MTMCKFFRLLAILLFIFISNSYAKTTEDQPNFQAIFSSWTDAFNQKKYPEVCDLFSPSLISNYQGAPQKNYTKTCEGFQKIFLQEKQKNISYHNDFKIHQIYYSGNLAAVRITWYLDIYKNGKLSSSIQEEGLDIFEKQPNGQWKIVNFIAYPIK